VTRVKPFAHKAWLLFRETMAIAWKHDCMGQSKAAAYSMVLFFFPLLLFCVATLVATNTLTVVFDPIQRLFPSFLPQDTRSLIWDYVNATSQRDPTQLLVGSFVILLWTGWGLMSTFIEGVNRAYGLHEERTMLRDQIAALKLLVFTGVPVICFGITTVLGSRVEAWIGSLGDGRAPEVADLKRAVRLSRLVQAAAIAIGLSAACRIGRRAFARP